MGIDVKYNVNKVWLGQVTKMETSVSAGYNLFSTEDKILKASSVTVVATHLHLEISLGYFGHIYPRSSLAHYHFLHVEGGIIDSDFCGEIIVVIFNHLSKTEKVLGGFGSTSV